METAKNVARMFGGLLVAALATITLAGLLGSLNPWFDRFANFPHWYAGCAAILAAALYVPSRRASGVAAVLFVVNLIPLVPYLPWAPSCKPDFAALTINARNDRSDHDALIARLEERLPEVLWICELDPALLEKVRRLYPHVVFDPDYDQVALLSTFPIRESHHRTSKLGRPHIEAVVDTAHGPLRVFGVHALPPFADELSIDRDEALGRIAADAGQSTEPVLVLGDLNNTMFAPTFRPLEDHGLVNSRRGQGLAATWPSTWLMRLPIDHVLTSESLRTCGVEAGPSFGSDHLPFEAFLRWR